MVNETDDLISTCFGFQMDVRMDQDGKLTAEYVEFRKQGRLSYSLAWMNCSLNVLLGAITILYNSKILANGGERRRKWTFSTMALFNLAAADLMVGFVVLPCHALLLAVALLGETLVCQTSVQMLFESLQTFFSSASFHGVVIVTIERYISVIYCMKCTVIMTKARMMVATLTAWLVSSSFGIATLFTAPQTVQSVLSMQIIFLCFVLGSSNIKMHLVAKAQRTRICLQRLSVRNSEKHHVKKHLKRHRAVVMVITKIILCYVPRALFAFLPFTGVSVPTDLFKPWLWTLFFAASSLNPFVYYKTMKKSALSRKREIYGAASSSYYNGSNV